MRIKRTLLYSISFYTVLVRFFFLYPYKIFLVFSLIIRHFFFVYQTSVSITTGSFHFIITSEFLFKKVILWNFSNMLRNITSSGIVISILNHSLLFLSFDTMSAWLAFFIVVTAGNVKSYNIIFPISVIGYSMFFVSFL